MVRASGWAPAPARQDMYPCDFGQPKPIAQRTYAYLRGVGIGTEEE